MAESGVILPADSTGKALRSQTATTTFTTGSGGVVHQQVVTLGDAAGNLLGTTAAPLPVITAGDVTAGTIANTATVNVPTSATSVLAAGTYRAIVLENLGTDYIYLGATGLTTTSYFKRLTAGEVLALTPPFVPSNAIFALAASGTQPLAVGVVI